MHSATNLENYLDNYWMGIAKNGSNFIAHGTFQSVVSHK